MSELDTVFETVDVKIDMESHPEQGEPVGESQRVAWAYLDTAYKLLRIASVRVTLQDIREAAVESGFQNYPTDEEVFADTEGEDAPHTYLDLAADSDLSREFLMASFARLVQDARDGMVEGFTEVVSELKVEGGVE